MSTNSGELDYRLVGSRSELCILDVGTRVFVENMGRYVCVKNDGKVLNLGELEGHPESIVRLAVPIDNFSIKPSGRVGIKGAVGFYEDRIRRGEHPVEYQQLREVIRGGHS